MHKINISGVIGWDIYASDIKSQLAEIKPTDPVDIEINSPGGSVFEGIEISNLIKSHEGPVNIIITGLAASMGSYIAMSGDTITANDDATFMIHNASTIEWGDHRALRKTANVIESLTGLLSKAYARKTGQEVSEIRGLMDDETWLFGDEIKTAGFVDEIISQDSPEDKEDAVAFQKLVFQDSIKKLEKKESEIDKLAAYFKATAPAKKPKQPEQTPVNSEKEKVNMNLSEFLKANPTAQAEFDQRITAAVGEIATQRKETAAKVAPIIMSDAYGTAIKNAGLKVLSGEKDYSSFEDLVAVVDEQNEMRKSEYVQASQPDPTPAEQDAGEPDATAKMKTAAAATAKRIGVK